MDGELGAFYRANNFFVGQTVRHNVISVEDGFGIRRWEAPLVDPKRPDAPIAITNVQLSQGRVHGHLVILAYGFHLFAIDPLGDPRHGEPRVIWRADLAESIPGMARIQAIGSMQVPQTFGPTRNVAVDGAQRRIGNTACLGESGIVYQSGRTLYCVSPVTGEIQWSREDMEAGSTLFGDAEVVCVIGHMSREVQLLDAVDGHDLDKREVPEEMRRIAMHGRLLVSWTEDREAKQQELNCRDMLTNETVWFERFAINSRGWTVDDESIGVYEPGGKFKLIRIADGKPLVNEMLERTKTLADIFVFAGRDQYTLLVNDVVPQQDRRRINPVAGGLNNPAVFGNGRLYAFDSKTGRSLWRKPTEVLKQGIALRQPADLPALVFLSMPSGGGGRVARRQGNLLCIDKRTGRELYQQTYPLADGANGLQLSADVAKQTMSVATNGKSFDLQFKDGPPPPEPPDAAGDLQAGGKKSGPGSILFSALKALGQASQDVASPIRPPHEEFQTGNGSQFFETEDSGGSQFGDDLPPFEGDDDDEDPFLPE
jgi:outer membrane protein assembly factor BamB